MFRYSKIEQVNFNDMYYKVFVILKCSLLNKVTKSRCIIIYFNFKTFQLLDDDLGRRSGELCTCGGINLA